MNWQLLIPLLVTTVVAILGWYIAHHLQARRDRAAKRRELRVSYLIDAYRRLEQVCNRQPLGPEESRQIESAIADIQLFGTTKQVKLACTFISEYASNQNAEIIDLLADLRRDLRSELELPLCGSKIAFLRITFNENE